MKRRNTPAKQAILSLLEASKTALSQEAIEQKLVGQMDRVTMYRVLNSFCEDGITHRIMSDDGKYYFALCQKCDDKKHLHNHFHFRCLQCQKVECLKEEVEVAVPKGYTLANSNCWVSGYCNKCS